MNIDQVVTATEHTMQHALSQCDNTSQLEPARVTMDEFLSNIKDNEFILDFEVSILPLGEKAISTSVLFKENEDSEPFVLKGLWIVEDEDDLSKMGDVTVGHDSQSDIEIQEVLDLDLEEIEFELDELELVEKEEDKIEDAFDRAMKGI